MEQLQQQDCEERESRIGATVVCKEKGNVEQGFSDSSARREEQLILR